MESETIVGTACATVRHTYTQALLVRTAPMGSVRKSGFLSTHNQCPSWGALLSREGVEGVSPLAQWQHLKSSHGSRHNGSVQHSGLNPQHATAPRRTSASVTSNPRRRPHKKISVLQSHFRCERRPSVICQLSCSSYTSQKCPRILILSPSGPAVITKIEPCEWKVRQLWALLAPQCATLTPKRYVPHCADGSVRKSGFLSTHNQCPSWGALLSREGGRGGVSLA